MTICFFCFSLLVYSFIITHLLRLLFFGWRWLWVADSLSQLIWIISCQCATAKSWQRLKKGEKMERHVGWSKGSKFTTGAALMSMMVSSWLLISLVSQSTADNQRLAYDLRLLIADCVRNNGYQLALIL